MESSFVVFDGFGLPALTSNLVPLTVIRQECVRRLARRSTAGHAALHSAQRARSEARGRDVTSNQRDAMEDPESEVPADAEPSYGEQFRKRKTRQYLLIVPALLAAGAIGWARERETDSPESTDPVVIGSFAVIAVVLGLSFFNWRCPACNQYLGKSFAPKHCPGCGVKLG